MKVESRPLTSDERAILVSLARPRRFSSIEWGGLLLLSTFAIWGLAYRGLRAIFPSFQNSGLIFYGVVFLTVFTCGWWYRIRKSRQSAYPEADQDLNQGKAEVTVLDIRKVVEVEELEDEGLGFYLETEEGKTLFLQGQYLYDLKDFPSTRIEIVRAPNSRIVFDLKRLGSPLKVSSKLPPFTPKDHELGVAHYDGDMLDQKIEEIIRHT